MPAKFLSPRLVQFFQRIFLLGFLGSAFLVTACGSNSAQPEARATQSQRQARFLLEMQKELRTLQESVAELKYLEQEMGQLKQIEQNQNRLLLDSQERFEERMAQMEQNLEQNNLKLRKLTGESPAFPPQNLGLVRPVPALPEAPKEPSLILEEAPPSALPPATDSAEMGAEQLFESGLALHSEKQYLKAIGVFEQLRKEYPDHPNGIEGHYLIGDAYFALQDYTKSAIVFYEFTDENPQYPNADDAQWKLAQSLEKSGEIGLALDIYQEMLVPGNPYRQQAQEKLQIYEKQSQ